MLLDIRAYVILQLDFPLCLVIVAKMKSSRCGEAEELIVVIRGLTSYCCDMEENVVAMRGLASYCCAAGEMLLLCVE